LRRGDHAPERLVHGDGFGRGDRARAFEQGVKQLVG
jgi:hypothetical protein